MNGVHDMGGLQCMGRIEYERNEPVFHAPWEGRVYALSRAIRKIGKWNIDTNRHTIESLPPAQYLRLSYYERWLAVLTTNLIRFGLVTKEEMESGKPATGSAKAVPVLTVAMAGSFNRGIASSQDPSRSPLFKVGARVRARNLNPVGHTRLPRYARGKTGVVVIDHGVYIFPDTNAHFQGEKRQHVYAVRFTARELWGEAASLRHVVHVDLWDDYLEHA